MDWKPERAIQAKVRDFQNKIKQKGMTAEARQWRNTLRWSTNGNFFQTLGQQWASSPRDIGCYLIPGFTPSTARFVHNNIICKEVCRVFVLRWQSTSHLTYCVLSHWVHFSYTIHIVIQVTSIHSCINTFTYSYTSYTPHHSHMITLVIQNLVLVMYLQFGLYLSLCQAPSFYKGTSWIYLLVIKSVIPSVSGPEMSLIISPVDFGKFFY